MANIYDLSDTWNDAGTTFNAIKMNVTDTASAATSLLMDLQVGGTSKFNVRKDGRLYALSASISQPFDAAFGTLHVNSAGESRCAFGSASYIGWGSTVNANVGLPDVRLYRDAADTLAQRRSTNAQTFNLYNTYTNATNYERGFMKWNSNVLEIGTEAAGTGTARIARFLTGNAAVANAPQFKLSEFNTGLTLTSNDDVFIVCNGTVNAGFQNSGSLRLISWNGAADVGFSSAEATSSPDTSFSRVSAGVMGVRAGAAVTGGALNFLEQTAPTAPAANQVVIYAEDDGAGKTRLMALFATGAAQQIAIEP